MSTFIFFRMPDFFSIFIRKIIQDYRSNSLVGMYRKNHVMSHEYANLFVEAAAS